MLQEELHETFTSLAQISHFTQKDFLPNDCSDVELEGSCGLTSIVDLEAFDPRVEIESHQLTIHSEHTILQVNEMESHHSKAHQEYFGSGKTPKHSD